VVLISFLLFYCFYLRFWLTILSKIENNYIDLHSMFLKHIVQEILWIIFKLKWFIFTKITMNNCIIEYFSLFMMKEKWMSLKVCSYEQMVNVVQNIHQFNNYPWKRIQWRKSWTTNLKIILSIFRCNNFDFRCEWC
jgi:hypothetical protein